MYRIAMVALLVSAGLEAQDFTRVYSTASRPRALAVIADRYHSPVYIRDGLAAALVRENIPVTFVVDTTALTAAALREHQLLIILRDGMNWPDGYDKPYVRWMPDEQQKAIVDFVNAGGAFLPLHNATAIYPPAGPYYDLLGGDFIRHPAPYQFTVRVEDRNHPVTAGVEDFQVYDEHHFIKYALDPKNVLLRNMAPNNSESPGGWWRESGKGRMVFLSLGHTPEAFAHPMFQRLLRNAINWTLRLP